MAYNDPDPYNQPEAFDLTQVAMIDFSDGNYQFDYRIVWRHESGKLYTARDCGCSCPSPFEDYTSLDHLFTMSIQELVDEAREEQKSDWYDGRDTASYIEKLRELE